MAGQYRRTGEDRAKGPDEGPLGDVIPERQDQPAPGARKPEAVEDRPVVGEVTPEDYPQEDRAMERAQLGPAAAPKDSARKVSDR